MESIDQKFFLAPMAEITTAALRRVVREFSSDVILSSEMISAGALTSGAAQNEALVQKHDFDDPIMFQIIGNKPEAMRDACSILSQKNCYSININIGCSAPDILKKGFGSKLLTDMKTTREIMVACRKATNSKLSVKLRCGFDHYNETYLIEYIRMLQDEGVDFIVLHPRLANQHFKRFADWNIITNISKAVDIPVVGNGDITTASMAMERLQNSGSEGIMIGRESVKSPWIFSLCKNLLEKTNNVLEINIHSVFIKTLKFMEMYLPEHLHESRSRRFCFYFTKNVKYSHELFRKIRNVSSIEQIINIVDEYFSRNSHESKTIYTRDGNQFIKNKQVGGNNGLHENLD